MARTKRALQLFQRSTARPAEVRRLEVEPQVYRAPQSELSEWEKETCYAAFLEGVEPSALPLSPDVQERMAVEWAKLSALDSTAALDACISFFETEESV